MQRKVGTSRDGTYPGNAMADIRAKQVKMPGKVLDESRGRVWLVLLRIALAIMMLIVHTGWITGGMPHLGAEPGMAFDAR